MNYGTLEWAILIKQASLGGQSLESINIRIIKPTRINFTLQKYWKKPTNMF